MSLRIWACCLAILAWPAAAKEYRMPVEEPQNFVLEEALVSVVQGAAEQMTGMTVGDMQTEAPDLFALSEALVNSYGFDSGTFLVDVDVEGLKTRLGAAGIPLWVGPRPEFLLWATEERGLERVMIGLEPNPIVDGVLQASQRFALPIRRPLMDLDDTLALSPAEVWGGFSSVVERASSRYGAEHVVVIGDRPNRQSTRVWIYEPGRDVQIQDLSGETIEARVEEVMRALLSHARGLQVVESAPAMIEPPLNRTPVGASRPLLGNTVEVTVTYRDAVRLMALLDHLEADPSQASIRALQLSEGVARIELQTELSLEAADQLISSFSSVTFVSPLSYALN